MKIGFDYWNVISHYPEQFAILMNALHSKGHSLHVISAIGKNRIGTIESNVEEALGSFVFAGLQPLHIHEVIFERAYQSPQLKLKKCMELGIEIFYDDRQDVVDLLNANGILAFLVPRKKKSTDIGAEIK